MTQRPPCNPCSSAWLAKLAAKKKPVRKNAPQSNAARTLVSKKRPQEA